MECNNFSPNVVEYTVPVYIIHTWKPSMNHSRGKGSRWCGLYRHNDWCILHPAHLPHSQALAAFITCKFVNVQIFGHKAAVHLSFQHHKHSLTIIYTPFYSAQSSGWGIFSLQDCGTSYHAILLHRGELREWKTGGWGCSSYLVEVLPESLEEFLSILLNHPPQCSQLLCTILLGQGAATVEPIPHTGHNLDEEKVD